MSDHAVILGGQTLKAKVWFARTGNQPKETATARDAARLADAAGLSKMISENSLVGILQHIGEGKNTGHVGPAVTGALADKIKVDGGKPFLTGSVTLYSGNRHNACDHAMHAHDHGFVPSAIHCPVIMCDGLIGSDRVAVDVVNARHHQRAFLGSAVAFMNNLVVVTHPTGHMLAGYGGAIKNVAMGLSSRGGKMAMHHGGIPVFMSDKCTACGACAEWCPEQAIHIEDFAVLEKDKCIGCGQCFTVCQYSAIDFHWAQSGKVFQERLVDYAAAAKAKLEDRILYISVVCHFKNDCDCMGMVQEPICPDVGVLAATDIVAIDQATVDLLNESAKRDVVAEVGGADFCDVSLAYAEELGLGTRDYELVEIATDS